MDNTQESEEALLSHDIKSTLISRNITVFGRRTSVRLEPEMWVALREISKRERCSIHDICSLIGVRKNENTSLTAAIRVFLMLYFRSAATEIGHRNAGHGSFEEMKRRARIPSEYMCFFKAGKETQEHLNGQKMFEQNNALHTLNNKFLR